MFDGDFNPLRLILHVGNLYGIRGDELDRLIDYVEVSEGGYVRMPLKRGSELSKQEVAAHVKHLDPRLEWKEDRWKFE